LIKPYQDQSGSRKEQVQLMFNRIANKYDTLNHVLSLNVDKRWRKKLVKIIQKDLDNMGSLSKPAKILDIATGTGDLAFAMSKIPEVVITGVDISEEMLKIARVKNAEKKLTVDFSYGDSEQLEYKDKSYHVATVAFGVRNFENLELGLKEIFRVLDTSGKVYILEFSKPTGRIFSGLYSFYSHRILPLVASMFTSEKNAYIYLPSSIDEFPSGQKMTEKLEEAGFENVSFQLLSGGISTLYYGTRNI
jgi:demethylmenaquinone methyltransferase / 2-methoxy-6-polyprenyl-1,4-benzoquinol methylase